MLRINGIDMEQIFKGVSHKVGLFVPSEKLDEFVPMTYKDRYGNKHLVFLRQSAVKYKKDIFSKFFKSVYNNFFLDGIICKERQELYIKRMREFNVPTTRYGSMTFMTVASIINALTFCTDGAALISYTLAWLYNGTVI